MVLAGCVAPLTPPPPHAATMLVDTAGLSALRAAVAATAPVASLPADRVDDLRVVVTELAANAITHAGAAATARWWLWWNVPAPRSAPDAAERRLALPPPL